jgi:hypothetical protein
MADRRREARPYRQVRLPQKQLDVGIELPANSPFLMEDREIVPLEAIAWVRFEPQDLETRLGVEFQYTTDDLDSMRIVVLELYDGVRISLIRHVHDPNVGTEIHINPSDFASLSELKADVFGAIDRIQAHALDRVLRALPFDTADITWVRPRMP